MKGQASLLGAVLWKPNEECFPLRDLASVGAKKKINNSSTAQQSFSLSAVDVCKESECEYAMQNVKDTNSATNSIFTNVHIYKMQAPKERKIRLQNKPYNRRVSLTYILKA